MSRPISWHAPMAWRHFRALAWELAAAGKRVTIRGGVARWDGAPFIGCAP